MRRYRLLVLLLLLVGPGLVPAREKKEDRDQFQGTWEVVKLEQTGQDFADWVKGESPTMTYDGDKYTFKGKTVLERGEFKLDPKAKIPTLDYTITEGEHKGKRQLGIYKLEGDTLTLCLAQEGADTRPTTFTTRADAAEYVKFVLKRQPK
jgi:uncharacterized protein (TIGR03067 family)